MCSWKIVNISFINKQIKIFSYMSNGILVWHYCRLPTGDLWSLFVNIQLQRMDLWSKIVPLFEYDPEQPFFEMLVPTADTIRFGYIMEKLLYVNKPVLFTGDTGEYWYKNCIISLHMIFYITSLVQWDQKIYCDCYPVQIF